MAIKDYYNAMEHREHTSSALDSDLERCPEPTGEELKVMLPNIGGIAWFMSLAEIKWLADRGWVLEVSKI